MDINQQNIIKYINWSIRIFININRILNGYNFMVI